jgi:hypothetical protein
MDASVLYRSFSGAAIPLRPASALGDGAVDTLLPTSSQSVGAIVASDGTAQTGEQSPGNQGSTKGQGQPSGQPDNWITGKFERDAASNTMVYMELNSRSGEIVAEVPDASVLKVRAYIAELERRRQDENQSASGNRLTKTS